MKLAAKTFCSLVLVYAVLSIQGCASPPQSHKSQVDEDVYKIIEHKWDEDFGDKANYRISDVKPDVSDIKAEKAIPDSGIVTLSDAVAIATTHNRHYQLEKEALFIKALDLRLARHDFESQPFAAGQAGYYKEGNDEQAGAGASYGFSQLMADGTRIGADIALAWVDILTGNARGGFAAIFSAVVTKPLLRGGDSAAVLENLTQAERDSLYQVRLFNRFRKTFVVSVVTQYYLVLQKLEAFNNARDHLNKLLQTYERFEKLAHVGRIERHEVQEAYHDKLTAQDNLIRAEKDYKQALDEFKITLSLPTESQIQLDISELDTLTIAQITDIDFPEDEAIETAMLCRLDLANSADAVADAKRKIEVAADNLGAELNINASVSVPAKGVSTAESLEQMAGVGLELDLPIDRAIEQNIYRKALINHSQRQREFEQARDTVVLQIRQAYRDMIEASQLHYVQLQTLELSQKRFKDTLELLQYNRASVRDVLDAQEDLYDARDETAITKVDYTIATLSFYRDSGILQVRPDGMWQRKIYLGSSSFEQSRQAEYLLESIEDELLQMP